MEGKSVPGEGTAAAMSLRYRLAGVGRKAGGNEMQEVLELTFRRVGKL